MKAILTVRLDKNPNHETKNKITDVCPLNKNKACTDAAGEHHSTIIFGRDLEEIKKQAGNLHVTRIEVVDNENYPEHRFATFVLSEAKDQKELGEIFKRHEVMRWELYEAFERIDEINQAQIMCIAIEWKVKT